MASGLTDYFTGFPDWIAYRQVVQILDINYLVICRRDSWVSNPGFGS